MVEGWRAASLAWSSSSTALIPCGAHVSYPCIRVCAHISYLAALRRATQNHGARILRCYGAQLKALVWAVRVTGRCWDT